MNEARLLYADDGVFIIIVPLELNEIHVKKQFKSNILNAVLQRFLNGHFIFFLFYQHDGGGDELRGDAIKNNIVWIVHEALNIFFFSSRKKRI